LWATPATVALLLAIVFLAKSRHDQQRIILSQEKQIAELRREKQIQTEQMARMQSAKPNDKPEVRPEEPRGYYKGPFYSLVLTMVPVRSPGERIISPSRGETMAIPKRANTLDLAIKLDDSKRHDHYSVEIKNMSGGLIWEEEDLLID